MRLLGVDSFTMIEKFQGSSIPAVVEDQDNGYEFKVGYNSAQKIIAVLLEGSKSVSLAPASYVQFTDAMNELFPHASSPAMSARGDKAAEPSKHGEKPTSKMVANPSLADLADYAEAEFTDDDVDKIEGDKT